MGVICHLFSVFIVVDGKRVYGELMLTDKFCQFTYNNNSYRKFRYDIRETTIHRGTDKAFLTEEPKHYVYFTYQNADSEKYYIEDEIDALIGRFNNRKKSIVRDEQKFKISNETGNGREGKHLTTGNNRIEIQKKIEDKNNRITNIVADLKRKNEAISFDDKITITNKSAVACITDNPKRILGLPCDATVEDANSSFDRFKKLARIGAVESFDSDYKLYGLDSPKRDISICQKALSDCKSIEHCFLWFIGKNALIGWTSPEYRDEFARDGIKFASYDIFLAAYLYLLITDSEFTSSDWQNIFAYIDFVYSSGSIKFLKSRFAKDENLDLSDNDILNLFKNTILKPVYELVDRINPGAMLRLYSIISVLNKKTLNELETRIPSKIISVFDEKASLFSKEITRYKEMPDALNEYLVTESYSDFKDEYLYITQNFDTTFGSRSARLSILKDKYKSTVWELMVAYNNHGKKKLAIEVANDLYRISSDEEKRLIRFTFGINAVKHAENNVTESDSDIMGDNYYNGDNGYKQDYYKAFRYYKYAADKGNMFSMNSLGTCYRGGKGTDLNYGLAAMWYEKAYQKGNPDGAYNLAECYFSGIGKPKNVLKAAELWLEAAKLGHPTAAERGKQVLERWQAELDFHKSAVKRHRLLQHNHYDLGYQILIVETMVAEVELNYSANVYLMDEENYNLYTEGEDFVYYGGRANQSPYRIKIPCSGFWHIVVDNGDDDMTGITSTVHIRTFNS